MKIMMTGIDYKHSGLSVREKFSVTNERLKQVAGDLHAACGIDGCVVLSTCNRTEIYTCTSSEFGVDLTAVVCGLFHLDYDTHRGYFTQRENLEAFGHLCRVCAGLDSQIMGDDQIITQARQALELSRELGCAGSYLETVFKLAIKSAKVIKTEIILRDPKSSSAPFMAVEKLKSVCGLENKNAVVIGNGHMGRLAAELLISRKSNVTITLREYKKGIIHVPEGASTISYSHRYEALEKADIVVSATSSPHHTIRYDEFTSLNRRPRFLADLAVPRDIEPAIGELDGVTLFTIDDLADRDTAVINEISAKSEEIIALYADKYQKWLDYKDKALCRGGL